jgi:hypothetical protein
MRSRRAPLGLRALLGACVATAAGALALACSQKVPVRGGLEATPAAAVPPGEGAGSGVGSGGNGSSGASGGSGSGTGTPKGYELGAVDGGVDPDAGCAASTTQSQLHPVDLLLMVDKSGSMADDGKWAAVTSALDGFFADPASAGLRVALRFFPDGACDSQACSVAECAKPLVDLAPLTLASAPADAQEAALVAAMASRSPGGDTPMFAALSGAEAWGAKHQGGQDGEKATVVLVTDGEPNGCNDDILAIASAATNGRLAHGIATYAVGLAGSNVDHMNLIAQAGGTKQAFFIGAGDVGAALLAALKQIEGEQIACDLAIPAPPKGALDPGKVNVVYVPGDGSSPVTIGRVEGPAFCTHGGWYFDDASAPTKVLLCDSTCSAVRTDVVAKLEIVLGCDSLLN